MRHLKLFNEGIKVKDGIDTLNEISDIFLDIEDEFGINLDFIFYHYVDGPDQRDRIGRVYDLDGNEIMSHMSSMDEKSYFLISGVLLLQESKIDIKTLIELKDSLLLNIQRVENQLGITLNLSKSDFAIKSKMSHDFDNDWLCFSFYKITWPINSPKKYEVERNHYINSNVSKIDLNRWLIENPFLCEVKLSTFLHFDKT